MSRQPSSDGLLPGFFSVEDLLDQKCRAGSHVNIMGIVSDARQPMQTRGTDWKSSIQFYDKSVEYDPERRMEFNIFLDKENMPSPRCGDVLVVLHAKVQIRAYGSVSLVYDRSGGTSIFLFAADSLHVTSRGKSARDPEAALRPSKKPQTRNLTKDVLSLVAPFYHNVSKDDLPTVAEFDTAVVHSLNVRDKFSELKDVQEDKFYDLIGLVVKQPYEQYDKALLWISDYTENPLFFSVTRDHASGANTGNQDGDEFGYMTKFNNGIAGDSNPANQWEGPFGKMSLQITCFEPHSQFIRDQNIDVGTWLHLRNVQVKFGRNGGNLEGYLREDRQARGAKVQVAIVNPLVDSTIELPRIKEALRRKRDYEKKDHDQSKAIADAAKAGQKRKAAAAPETDGQAPLTKNQKKRAVRREKEKLLKKACLSDAQMTEHVSMLALNPEVRVESQQVASSTITEIVAPKLGLVQVDGQEVMLELPFANLHYRANVRIVDFLPKRLEDFARPRLSRGEYDILSDDGDTGSDADLSGSDIEMGTGRIRGWEWRFLLKLVDAETNPEEQEQKSIWANVDNSAAQCLTGLDASDLNRNYETLGELRQTMFQLWGNLEEIKSRQLDQKEFKAAIARQGAPPPSSDPVSPHNEAEDEVLSNRPFPCCLVEHGVKVSEDDASKANAGPGRRWQRTFKLDGTRILKHG